MKHALWVLLLVAVPAQGLFMDPIPGRGDPATAVAGDAEHIYVGLDTGHVLAFTDAGTPEWSLRSKAWPVADLAPMADAVVASWVDASGASRLGILDGTIGWTHDAARPIRALAAFDDRFLAGDADGAIVIRDATGATIAQTSVTGAVLAADADGQRFAVAAAGLHVLGATGQIVATADFAATDVAIDGDTVWAVADGAVHRFLLQGSQLSLQASHTLAYGATAVASSGGVAAAGDPQSFITPLSHAGPGPAIETFARAITDIAIVSGQAAVATAGGWLGHVPLDTRPIVLITSPEEHRHVPGLARINVAYADPDAEPGDVGSLAIDIREPGQPWQRLAQGDAPLDRLTKQRTIAVDLSAFQSGIGLQVRAQVTDVDGLTGEDRHTRYILVDNEPPKPFGSTVPAEGEIVDARYPLIAVGHKDSGSGVDPDGSGVQLGTQVWVDDAVAFILEKRASFTRAKPNVALDDGPHTWTVDVRDRAGNLLRMNGTFIVDTQAPKIVGEVNQVPAADRVAVQWNTDEPTTCTLKVGQIAVPSARGRDHSVVLDGLAAGQDHAGRIDCTDQVGRSVVKAITLRTTAPPAGAPQPTLNVFVTPSPGATGWHQAKPTLTASTDIPSTVYWSLSGSPWAEVPPDVSPGQHTLSAFALSDDGVASTTWKTTIRFDDTPASHVQLSWHADVGVLTWSRAHDAQSGIAGFEVWGGDPPRRLASTGPEERRFDGVPADFHRIRVDVLNGAGARTTGTMVYLGEAPRVGTSVASLENRTVPADGAIKLRLWTAPGDTFTAAVLTDGHGVERTFRGTHVGLGGRLVGISAAASQFPSGSYTASVRLASEAGPFDLPLGSITLLGDREEAVIDDTDTIIVERDSPLPIVWMLVAVAFALRGVGARPKP